MNEMNEQQWEQLISSSYYEKTNIYNDIDIDDALVFCIDDEIVNVGVLCPECEG